MMSKPNLNDIDQSLNNLKNKRSKSHNSDLPTDKQAQAKGKSSISRPSFASSFQMKPDAAQGAESSVELSQINL